MSDVDISIQFNTFYTHLFGIGQITTVYPRFRSLHLGLIVFDIRLVDGQIEE
ncbi:hypothetical protein D3C81_942680 [compost metagenome]